MIDKENIKQKIKGIKKVKTTNNCVIYHIDGLSISNSHNLMIENPFGNEKTAYFIIENGNFINGLFMHANINTHVIFKNCIFHQIICINSCGEVIFENNRYYADATYPTFPKYFFNCKSKNLRFSNDIFSNCSYQTVLDENILGANIETKFLTIDESLIKFNDENSKIKIKAQEITIFDSDIQAANINIEFDDIYNLNSTISSNNSIKIKNKNNCDLEGISAPTIIYNGEVVEKAKVFSI